MKRSWADQLPHRVQLILCYYALRCRKDAPRVPEVDFIPLEANEDEEDDLDRALGESRRSSRKKQNKTLMRRTVVTNC